MLTSSFWTDSRLPPTARTEIVDDRTQAPRRIRPVYIHIDPEKCVCRGAGQYWAVGESPAIYNVFSVYPRMPYLDERLMSCELHGSAARFTVDDAIALEDLGIAMAVVIPEA